MPSNMPVRSSISSVLVWPSPNEVIAAARQWAAGIGEQSELVTKVGCFGSYARGDAGVGSDLDLVAIVLTSDAPFERRSASWDTTGLPVPVDLLVYTRDEWTALQDTPFGRTLAKESVWLFEREP